MKAASWAPRTLTRGGIERSAIALVLRFSVTELIAIYEPRFRDENPR